MIAGSHIRNDRKVVLVVDDEPLVRMNAVDMFEDMGFEVLEANDGLAALQVLEGRSDVSLLFSDCRMPGMTGPELAEVAAERWPHLRIVLVSGYINIKPTTWPLCQNHTTRAPFRRSFRRRLPLKASLP